MQAEYEKRVDVLIKDLSRVKPEFIAQPNMDKLVAVVLRLAMENSVLRDRIERQEHLLKTHNVLTEKDYETFEPDPEMAKQSQAANFDLIRAIAKDLA